MADSCINRKTEVNKRGQIVMAAVRIEITMRIVILIVIFRKVHISRVGKCMIALQHR